MMALDRSPELRLALVVILFILAILVEGHPRNISVKLFWNQAIGLGDVI